MWFPVFEALSDAYGWTLKHILWNMTLPQVMRYLTVRADRIEEQNERMKEQSESGSSEHSMRPMSERQIERKRAEMERRKREYDESIKPENAPSLGSLVNDFSQIFGG